MAREYEVDRYTSSQLLALGTGVVVGALIGAGLALLFAPKSGAALRRDIARRTRHLHEDAAAPFEHLGELAGDVADRGRDVTRRARHAVTTGVHELRRRADAAIDRIEEAGD